MIAVNGLYRHGWLIAPALAERVVDRLMRFFRSRCRCVSF